MSSERVAASGLGAEAAKPPEPPGLLDSYKHNCNTAPRIIESQVNSDPELFQKPSKPRLQPCRKTCNLRQNDAHSLVPTWGVCAMIDLKTGGSSADSGSSPTLNLYLRDNYDSKNTANSLTYQSEAQNSGVEDSESKPSLESDYLSESSPRDKPWDDHRIEAEAVSQIYAMDPEFHKYSERVSLCSLLLGFAWRSDYQDPTAQTLKLRSAHFCRVRHCPICQWRRSKMWQARFFQNLPRLMELNPTARFVFLTLTQRNVQVLELRTTLIGMNKGWTRLSSLKAFNAGVLGWVRTTEVTRRPQDGTAHPHFHVLLMVQSNYFTKHYLPQAQWVQMWRKALRAAYDPIVHIQRVKSNWKAADAKSDDGIFKAVRETLKYSVKPSDMIADRAWFLELTRQLQKLRFIASGGLLREALRPEEESEKDLLLLNADGEQADEIAAIFFGWNRPVQKYKRSFERE